MLRTKTSTILLQAIGWILLLGWIPGFTAHRGESADWSRVLRLPFWVPELYGRQRYGLYFLVPGVMLLGVFLIKPFEHLVHFRPESPLPPPHGPRLPAPGVVKKRRSLYRLSQSPDTGCKICGYIHRFIHLFTLNR